MTERVRNSDLLRPTMFDFGLATTMFNVFMNIVDPFKIGRKVFFNPLIKLLTDAFEEYKAKTQVKFEMTQNTVLKILAAVAIFILCVFGAILLYVLFYLLYMPTVIQVKPAFMQYNKICDSDSATCDAGSSLSSYHSFPQAHLQLTKKQLMMVGQPYVLTLKLELPETPRNQELGMFMLCMDMKDKDHILKSHACRSTMLRYRSPWLHKLKTLLLIPFYLIGWDEEKQTLDIEMFTNYVDTTNQVTDIYVEIQSRVVEFYSVSLEICAHFSGLRYLIHHFPIISAAVGITINLIVLVCISLIIWYHYVYEMEWAEDTKYEYTGKHDLHSKIFDNDNDYDGPMSSKRKVSSSISTTDENVSILDNSDDKFELEDDLLLFDGSDRKTEE
ncbi:seipin [Chironomus tepperi]|uniref:seipin n=1 Tax=Chironomus tepperi TaxID=113505 RepID=UPI00391F5A27